MAARAEKTPYALSTLSTHDTKRSVDARAVILALSHMPELARQLYGYASDEARRRGLPEAWGIYCLQTALIMHHADDARSRIKAHLVKALREAKTLSTYESPDEAVEDAIAALCLSLHRQLGDGEVIWSEAQIDAFNAQLESIVLAQVALHLSGPGIPDIYQGTETISVTLTDPDNRRAIDWKAIEEFAGRPARNLAGKKLALTRKLIALRQSDPPLFARGLYFLERLADGRWQVRRQLNGREARIEIAALG
jgi:(1->4)-alpha-D-glucan 1-alpha-D-glucosylmutase